MFYMNVYDYKQSIKQIWYHFIQDVEKFPKAFQKVYIISVTGFNDQSSFIPFKTTLLSLTTNFKISTVLSYHSYVMNFQEEPTNLLLLTLTSGKGQL